MILFKTIFILSTILVVLSMIGFFIWIKGGKNSETGYKISIKSLQVAVGISVAFTLYLISGI
jgi:hypothetical protein